MAPYTKQQLLDLLDTYIPATGYPNIRASEHQDLETKILDRVDNRILKTGTITVTNLYGYQVKNLTFAPLVSTSNYVVILTPYRFITNTNPYVLSYRTTYTITNRTTAGFTIQLYGNGPSYTGRFTYIVINKNPL